MTRPAHRARLRRALDPTDKPSAPPARAHGRFVLQLDLDASSARGEEAASSELPMFLRIARAIARDARSGRLAKGARLPGSRELASSLSVHRNTVLAAYRELLAEGFLQTAPGRGTFVATSLPEIKPRRWQGLTLARTQDRSRAGFAFTPWAPAPIPAPLPKGTLALYGGVPDTRLVPRAAFARATRRALFSKVDHLGYGDPQGEPSLRAALAEKLRALRGLSLDADDLLITRGSQMALALVGRVLLGPGDVIAVEALGYQPAWRALSAYGAKLRAVPVDAQGLDIDALAALCAREPVRAVYVTPHHQYPTTVTMSAGRRMALLQLARDKKLAIIEDDYDHEFHYEGRPVLPLASADDTGNVLYIGTMSKIFAPGLRIGYLLAPRAVREAALAARFDVDRQGDRITELALAELLEDGELQRHVWRARRVYRARRDHCVERLRAQLGSWLSFEPPSGGIALWARVAPQLDILRFAEEALARGVVFQPGDLFSFGQKPTHHLRIGYGGLTEKEMADAIGRLRKAALAALRQ
jgi:GntR family transcriptional regulator/MocR family aminotransferase